MAKGNFRLTAGHLKKKGPVKLCDGGGLWLYISKTNAKSWVLRYRFKGQDYELGLGSLAELSMENARALAQEYRELKKQGKNPKYNKIKPEGEDDNEIWTFDMCAEAYVKAHSPAWSNAKHTKQWKKSVDDYCSPAFGNLPVSEIDTQLIMQVIGPLWKTKTETASRVRGRIENILSWAIVNGYREGPNPAIWRGHLAMLLPQRNKVQKPKHYSAMPYKNINEIILDLDGKSTLSAYALKFTILTACRTNEALAADWQEFDLKKKLWTIPADRMKAKREHRVPLSTQAVTLLKKFPTKEGWLFPSRQKGKHLSNMAMLKFLKQDLGYEKLTVHGFRSTFRDWCAEKTHFPRELAESALAHVLTNKTEAAYQRGDLLEKRRELMQAWANYCHQKKKK